MQGFHTMIYRVRFDEGKATTVSVEGDGDTPLALLIVGPDGKHVAEDYDNPDQAVRFVPKVEEPYQVKVVNRGGVPNRFTLRID